MLKKNSENMYTTEKRWMDIPTTSSEDLLACRINFGVGRDSRRCAAGFQINIEGHQWRIS